MKMHIKVLSGMSKASRSSKLFALIAEFITDKVTSCLQEGIIPQYSIFPSGHHNFFFLCTSYAGFPLHCHFNLRVKRNKVKILLTTLVHKKHELDPM